MSIGLIATIAIVLLLVFILAEMPVGIAIAAAGATGIVLLHGTDRAGLVIGSTTFSATAKYSLFVVLMYVLLGTLMANAGVGAGIYRIMNRLVGRFPGGLAATAVAATTMFSGISGTSAADVATFGRISVNEMAKHGYSKEEASAIVAAAAAFAVLIPPSVIVIIYGIIAQVSIGALMLAAIVPGLLSCFVLMVYVVLRAWMRDRKAGQEVVVGAAREEESVDTSTATDALSPAEPTFPGEVSVDLDADGPGTLATDLMALLYAGILFVIVIGGLYSGIFTATEAGAVGAVAAILVALVYRTGATSNRRGVIVQSVREAIDITSMIFLLLVGGAIFTYFLAISGIAANLASYILTLPVEPIVIVGCFLLLLIPLGMFLDGLSVMLLTVPLAAPVVLELGFDGIWFGILTLKMIELGLITPPVGINIFIISGISRVQAEKIFRQVLPFVVLDLMVTAVFFIFPETVLWLPRAAGLF